MSRVIRAAASLAMAVALLVPAASLAQSPSETALLDALARVPATTVSLGAPITYVDYQAVAEARPGALAPESLAQLLTLHEADDPAAARWFAASMGIASGPHELLSSLLVGGPSWPESMGFDFADIHQAVSFGEPPADGRVLLGDFDPGPISAAHEARDYTATPTGDHLLLCSAAGCDAGLELDIERIDPTIPFGGRLGRQEPLAASSADVLSSAVIGTVQGMLAAVAGDEPAVADLPAIRSLISAADDDLVLVQATFLPGILIPAGPDLVSVLGAAPEQVEAILAEFEALAPLPMPESVAIVDGATPTEQVVTIALAYAADEDASQAAEVIADRLGSVRSIVRDMPLVEILDDRQVTSVTAEVVPGGADSRAVAKVEVRAPLADDEPTDAGGLEPSSSLYRLFVDMLFTRDLLWLAPTA